MTIFVVPNRFAARYVIAACRPSKSELHALLTGLGVERGLISVLSSNCIRLVCFTIDCSHLANFWTLVPSARPKCKMAEECQQSAVLCTRNTSPTCCCLPLSIVSWLGLSAPTLLLMPTILRCSSVHLKKCSHCSEHDNNLYTACMHLHKHRTRNASCHSLHCHLIRCSGRLRITLRCLRLFKGRRF